MKLNLKKLSNDNRGVFGLTAVQQFFIIILAIALLAYVIVVIMGTLQQANIIPTLSGSSSNELLTSNVTDGSYVTFANSTLPGVTCGTVSGVKVASNGSTIASANYTQLNCQIKATAAATSSGVNNSAWNVTYSFTYSSNFAQLQQSVLGNTSGGVVNFFGSVNPVYAILAVLVIILILVVLVRVVSGGGGGRESTPQL